MLDKLVAAIRKLKQTPVAVDPARFEDRVAMETEWTPARAGGASFCTRKLVDGRRGTVEFRATLSMKLFALAFLLGGIAACAVGYHVATTDPTVDLAGKLVPLVVGIVFIGVGGGMLYTTTIPIIFDRPRALFYKGARGQSRGRAGARPRESTPFGDIHAIQLIAEHVRTDKSSFYSYELNLVLQDRSRINVVDHGNLDQVRADAATLSRFLGCPLWDATENS